MEALRPQMSVALFVGLEFVVLPAINLENQPGLEADEIDDVAINGLLPAESPPSQTSIT